jgi:hypothetical protein
MTVRDGVRERLTGGLPEPVESLVEIVTVRVEPRRGRVAVLDPYLGSVVLASRWAEHALRHGASIVIQDRTCGPT